MNRYYDNTIMSYDANGQAVYGPLQTDRPHNFKLNGVYDFKWGTTLGANWFIQSGIPQSTTFRFSGFPVFPNGRNDLGRSPTISQLDLNINQEIPLPGHSRLNLQANIDNVFDQDTWTNYYLLTTQGPSPLSRQPDGGQSPGPVALRRDRPLRPERAHPRLHRHDAHEPVLHDAQRLPGPSRNPPAGAVDVLTGE